MVRNFHGGFSTSWQHAFNTDDRAAVERYCTANGIQASWREDGGLRTTATRRAVHRHPTTGAPVWFNHATFFHHTTLPAEVSEGLLELFGEDDLPTNTYYGDGGRIPPDVVAHLRACYRAESVRFDWRTDDVLVVDNMLASHAREPFTGPRRIAVAMSEAYRGPGHPETGFWSPWPPRNHGRCTQHEPVQVRTGLGADTHSTVRSAARSDTPYRPG
jgi:hypothetical protein